MLILHHFVYVILQEDPKNKSRSEDAAIAYTFNHFISNGTDEPEYILQLPMTKVYNKNKNIRWPFYLF